MREVIPQGSAKAWARWAERSSFLLEMGSIWAAGLFFILNLGDILMGVFSRYFFLSSPIWTEELARYSLVWMVMLAANPALRRGEHMGIDLLVQYFPARIQTALRWTIRALFLGITGFMAVLGWRYAWSVSNFTTMGLGIPKTVPLLAVPVGMGLLCVQYLLMLIAERSRSDESAEAP